jgi:hypothetical protein
LKSLQVLELDDGSARGRAVWKGDNALQVADAGVAALLLFFVRPLGGQGQGDAEAAQSEEKASVHIELL